MSNLLDKYREWVWNIPETKGDIIASVGYTIWCASLVAAILTFEAGAFAPMSACLGIAALITLLVYFP
jgi:hypothetical protein